MAPIGIGGSKIIIKSNGVALGIAKDLKKSQKRPWAQLKIPQRAKKPKKGL